MVTETFADLFCGIRYSDKLKDIPQRLKTPHTDNITRACPSSVFELRSQLNGWIFDVVRLLVTRLEEMESFGKNEVVLCNTAIGNPNLTTFQKNFQDRIIFPNQR